MRTTETMTVSLPPAMVKQFETVRRAENRTRSELVREALRSYFESRYPAALPSGVEMAAIRRGRAAFERGDYSPLSEVLNDWNLLVTGPRKSSCEGFPKETANALRPPCWRCKTNRSVETWCASTLGRQPGDAGSVAIAFSSTWITTSATL